MPIHWEEVLADYNARPHVKKCGDVTDMLRYLYDITGGSSRSTGAIIGVSNPTVRRKMREEGLGGIIRGRGGDNRSGSGEPRKQLEKLSDLELRKMTVQDVMKHCGCSDSQVYRMFRQTGRDLGSLRGPHRGVGVPKPRVQVKGDKNK